MIERRERFRRIYDDNYARIVGYARRRTDRLEDAQDVVSETFLIAWRRLDDVPDGERSRLWLYGTARKVLANHHRGRRRYRDLGERLQREPYHLGDGRSEDGPPPECVAAAFGRLTDADQEVLILTGWEGLDAGQIAEVLECPRTTARVRLHRARKRFAAALAREGWERSGSTGHVLARWATARPDSEEPA